MRWDITFSPTKGFQLRLKPIGVIRVELIDTAKKFRFMDSQKGIERPHSPNFHVHGSVGDLYIPTFGQCCQLLAELSGQLGGKIQGPRTGSFKQKSYDF
jgi:hypothetical protein